MRGISNTLNFIQENWSNFLFIIAIILVCCDKVKDYFKMSKEDRVKSTLVIIKKELLKLMCDAELDWSHIQKSGELKKSQVIKKIYEQFPILNQYVDQDELIKMIETMIEDGMEKMNSIINKIDQEQVIEESTNE